MKIVNLIMALMLAMTAQPLTADELHLEYADFYSHLRKLNNDELNTLQFAFGFLNVRSKELCQVESVLIDTDKQDIKIPVQSNQRFVLPNEKALKMAKARMLVKLSEPKNQCDLSVLLEVKPDLYAEGVSAKNLLQYADAFNHFFDKMGSFLSFMMPSPEGLKIGFKDGADVPESLRLVAQQNTGNWAIKTEQLERLPDDLTVSGINQITALMPR